MRPGPLEVVLILAIIVAIVIIARIARGGRRAGEKAAASRQSRGRPQAFFSRSGLLLVIVGVIGLAVAAGFFRLMLQGYLWSAVVIALGAILLLLSRRMT